MKRLFLILLIVLLSFFPNTSMARSGGWGHSHRTVYNYGKHKVHKTFNKGTNTRRIAASPKAMTLR